MLTSRSKFVEMFNECAILILLVVGQCRSKAREGEAIPTLLGSVPIP